MKTFVIPLAVTILIAAANASYLPDCTNSADGLYPLGNCEPRFLTCSGGIARIMDCPADLIYHESEQICDWRHNVVACGEGSGEETSGNSYRDETGSGSDSGTNYGESSGYEDVTTASTAPEDVTPAAQEPTTYETPASDPVPIEDGSTPVYEAETTIATTELSSEAYETVVATTAETPTETPASDVAEDKSASEYETGTTGISYGTVTPVPVVATESAASSTEAPAQSPPEDLGQSDYKAASDNESSGSLPHGELAYQGNVCEYRKDGVYSSGICTNFYFVCTSYSPRFLTCATPLYYDPVQQKCAWRESIEECKKEIVATTTATTSTTEGNEVGYNGSGEESSGEGSGEATPTCDGRADGIYPISECSTNFLTCSGGIARTMDCPSSLFFNPSQHVCDWQRNVVGCSGHSTPASQCDEDGYFSFGHCSSSFTACTNGNSIVMFCPSGLKFSQTNQICDYEHNVQECGGGSDEGSGEPAADETTRYENDGTDELLTSCTNMKNGLYALECTPRVLSCQNGHEDIFECPENLVFNEESLICDFPETSLKCKVEDHLLIRDSAVSTYDCPVDGVFTSSLCSRIYHKCSNGQLIRHECADSNAVFSTVEASCVDASYLPQCQ